MKRAAYALLAFAACAAALTAVFAGRSQSQTEAVGVTDIGSLSFQPHPGARLPLNVKLVDAGGSSIALETYFTKAPVVLVLDYLRCTSLCGVTLRNLVDTLNRTPLKPGRDYQLVAISIDPRDRPSDAAAASEKYAALLNRDGARGGLHFLTGAPGAVHEIASAAGFPYRYDQLLDAYIHPAGFVVVAPDGIISRYVEDFATSPEEMVAAFADAEQDKSQGPLRRLLLLCHIQGAPPGKWTIPVIAALMAGNIAAGVGALAIFAAIRRRRFG
jgi:protein SCO1/2